MKDKVFLDTNVLAYLYSVDEPEKQERAIKPMNQYEVITSTQALNEFSHVLIKKWKVSFETVKKAIDEIKSYCENTIVDTDIIKKALDIHGKYGYSYFDSLMLASSVANACKYILTEDMNDGQVIENILTIKNIFK